MKKHETKRQSAKDLMPCPCDKSTFMRLHTEGIGIIVPSESGVYYCNQIAGYACYHRSLEGIFIPLAATVYDEEKQRRLNVQDILDDYFFRGKYAGWCTNGIDNGAADFLDGLFKQYKLGIAVCRTKLKKCAEAWIYIKILEDDGYAFKGFKGQKGIFTWENSD